MPLSSDSSPESSASAPDPYTAQREAMVERFSTMKPPIDDHRVMKAMRDTPRHQFVPENYRHQAYRDHPLPIGHGQTISQPSLVAWMTQLLKPEPREKVLEIGTGSGYQASILSPLVADVYTIEIVETLGRQAARVFDELGYQNIHARIGDGHQGWPAAAPFDAIIVTCAPDAIPQPLVDQLAEGGRMVIPVGGQNEVQNLYLLEKTGGKIRQKSMLAVRFVPMTGGNGSN